MEHAAFEQAALVRQQKKISLEEIAESTKISLRYLRAIEEARFDRLPGGVYNGNYVRQYARAFGFDEQALLNAYLEATVLPEPQEAGGDRKPAFASRLSGALQFALGRSR
jgi:cytoskeletal protein RodZ